MNHMPKGYDKLIPSTNYIKLPKLSEGEHRFRIVQPPIAGWLDWKDKKPLQFPVDKKPLHSVDPEKPIKAFWALYVWDYASEDLYIMEITQSSLLKTLRTIGEDEEWGDFANYDIKITKKGSGKDTKYTLNPVPHKPLGAHIKDALKENPVNLSALYHGGDPWKDLQVHKEPESTSSASSLFDRLETELQLDGIDTDRLRKFIKYLADKSSSTEDEVCASALMEEHIERFKKKYLESLLVA